MLNGGFNALAALIADGRLSITPPGVPVEASFDISIQDRPIHLVDRDTVAAVYIRHSG
jgi:hypothetical protein